MGTKQRGTVSRTVIMSFCHGFNVIEGKPEEFNATLFGDFDAERATRHLRRKRDKTVTITEVSKERCYFSMPLDEFCKQAKCNVLDNRESI